jgi:transcription initiation factor IIE alpha subunit
MHPTFLLSERNNRHIVQMIERRTLFCDERLAILCRIKSELTYLREVVFRLGDKRIRVFHNGGKSLQKSRVFKLGFDIFYLHG